jgi:hypothetical protein
MENLCTYPAKFLGTIGPLFYCSGSHLLELNENCFRLGFHEAALLNLQRVGNSIWIKILTRDAYNGIYIYINYVYTIIYMSWLYMIVNIHVYVYIYVYSQDRLRYINIYIYIYLNCSMTSPAVQKVQNASSFHSFLMSSQLAISLHPLILKSGNMHAICKEKATQLNQRNQLWDEQAMNMLIAKGLFQ